jgi:hypothetical protein
VGGLKKAKIDACDVFCFLFMLGDGDVVDECCVLSLLILVCDEFVRGNYLFIYLRSVDLGINEFPFP